MFSRAGTCVSYAYHPIYFTSVTLPTVAGGGDCLWQAWQPSTNYRGLDCAVISNAESQAANVACGTATPPCYACERSPCRMGVDCFERGTSRMTGDYYPNCTCICVDGFTGSACNISVFEHQHHITSHYSVTCVNNVSSYSTARGACGALGEGWDLATFPTNASLRSLFSFTASDPNLWELFAGAGNPFGDKEAWAWSAGRFSKQTFTAGNWPFATCTNYTIQLPIETYQHVPLPSDCLWADMQPSGGTGFFIGSEKCVRVSAGDGRFSTASCDALASSQAATRHCAVCERSPCNISTDCFEAGTLRMDGGFYPNCKCVCMADFVGDSCNIAVHNHSHGLCTSHYTLRCGGGVSKHDDVRAACRGLGGGGWDLATFPTYASQNVMQAFSAFTAKRAGILFGADDRAVEGTWVWSAGRLSNLTFTKGSSCFGCTCQPHARNQTNIWNCNWVTGEPNNDRQVDANAGEDCAMIMNATNKWNDRPCDVMEDVRYACERSPCKMGTDCVLATTLSMQPGLFDPDCKCTCKEGFYGAMCEKARIDHGPFVSEYEYVCDGAKRNWSDAQSACRARGEGFELASIPTLKTSLLLRELIRPQSTTDSYSDYSWSSAIRRSDSGAWVWSSGRLRGQVMHANGTCLNAPLYTFNSSNATLTGNCPFRPAETGTSVAEGCGHIFTVTDLTTPQVLGDVNCSTRFSCILCERSPCRKTLDCPNDAESAPEPSGYYPNSPVTSEISLTTKTATMSATETFSMSETTTPTPKLTLPTTLSAVASLSVSAALTITRTTGFSTSQEKDASATVRLVRTHSVSALSTRERTIETSRSFTQSNVFTMSDSLLLSTSGAVTSTRLRVPATRTLQITKTQQQQEPIQNVSALPSPLASPLEEVGGTETAQTLGSASAAAVLVADPVTLMQLDAVASVMEMAACVDTVLLGDKSHRDKYDFTNNPLHLFIGAAEGAAERGGLVTCAIVMLLSCVGCSTALVVAQRRAARRTLSTSKADHLPRQSSLNRLPSMLFMPALFCLRIAVRAGLRLALFSPLAADIGGGCARPC